MKRWEKLQNGLKDGSLDALLIEDPIDLFYLTGFHLSAGKLFVDVTGAHLIVDGRYYESCASKASIPVILAQENALKDLLTSSQVKSLGFSKDNTTYQRFLELQQLPIKLIPVENPVKKLRSIKDKAEIEALRNAANLAKQGVEVVSNHLKEGISETELAIELEIFWKRKGGEGVAFEPIIAFGPNTSMPHYRAGSAILQKGQHVLVDIGVTLNHYQSDMTRVLFFGPPDPEMVKIYEIIQEAQQAALALCRPGTTLGTLDAAARDIISAKGYGSYFTHSLGHGIGLEVHEYPTLRNAPPFKDVPLEAGMAITIEPGIYLPGRGGVRYEDTIVITSNGYENLTAF